MKHRKEWLEVYMHECADTSKIDLHQKFADLIGSSRHEAKAIHVRNMYSVPMIRSVLNELEELRNNVTDIAFGIQEAARVLQGVADD